MMKHEDVVEGALGDMEEQLASIEHLLSAIDDKLDKLIAVGNALVRQGES